MIIGITGGTGSGKTTLLRLIASADGLILDCDLIYHQLLEQDAELQSAIAQRFPNAIENGKINRKLLGSIVFGEPSALAVLNKITHTAVKNEVVRQLESKPALAAIDAIGLFEGQLDKLCDITVAVIADRSIRIDRIMNRDSLDYASAASRVEAQKSDDFYTSRADFTVYNNSDEEALLVQANKVLDEIRKISEDGK